MTIRIPKTTAEAERFLWHAIDHLRMEYGGETTLSFQPAQAEAVQLLESCIDIVYN